MPAALHIQCPISPAPSHSAEISHGWTSIWNICLPPCPCPVDLSEMRSSWMRSLICENIHPAASGWKTCFQNRSEPFWSMFSIFLVTRKMRKCDTCPHNSSPPQALDFSGMDCVIPSFLQYVQPWIYKPVGHMTNKNNHPRQIIKIIST